jgi:hypothetical protein
MSSEQFLLLAPASLEVFSELGIMFQIVADDLVDVGQNETRKILHDLLSGSPAIECVDDQIERNPRAGHTAHSVGILG